MDVEEGGASSVDGANVQRKAKSLWTESRNNIGTVVCDETWLTSLRIWLL